MITIIKILLGLYTKIYFSAYSIDFSFVKPLYDLDRSKKKLSVLLNTKKNKNILNDYSFYSENLLLHKFLNLFAKNKFSIILKVYLNVLILKIIVSYGKYDVLISGSTGLISFSRNKKKLHIHIIHSMASLHTIYFHNSFYFYDYIFLTNFKQLEELNLLKVKDKNINASGKIMGYVDFKYNNFYFKKKDLNILIAPSWFQPDSFNNILQNHIINNLLSINNIGVIYLRPHPGLSSNQLESIKEILKIFDSKINIQLSIGNSIQVDFQRSDLMITDCSGVGIQYALQNLTPTFFIKETPTKQNNKYFIDSNIKSLERDLSFNFGLEVFFEKDQLHLNKLISKYLKSKKIQLEWKEKLLNSRRIFLKDSSNYPVDALKMIDKLLLEKKYERYR